MPSPQIVLDANVIVQALVRDRLLDADAYGLCRVRWTEAVLVEARRTLVGDFGRDPARIDALLAAMRQHFPRAAIVSYAERIAAMTNDPKDRHVAAAAARAGADIATFNRRHFRPADLAPFASRARHPDAFLMELRAAHPDTLAATIRAHAPHAPDTINARRQQSENMSASVMSVRVGSRIAERAGVKPDRAKSTNWQDGSTSGRSATRRRNVCRTSTPTGLFVHFASAARTTRRCSCPTISSSSLPFHHRPSSGMGWVHREHQPGDPA